jgi:molybdopterin molybdotransferase
LHGGKKISPYDIGLLIAIGLRQVSVTRKPKVGILSVGEELKEIDSLEHGKVVNNYTYIVSALISEFGAVPIMLGIASDNLEEIKGSIKSHINDLDVILTIGGCSVGEKDLVADAIKSLGAPGLIVHGVKAVVLKVAGYGSINGKPIVMLPGPVISAVGTFYVFVLPLLNILRGQDLYSYPLIFRAELEEEIRGKSGMGVFKLLELSLKNGKFSAKPLKGGTNLLSNLVKANAYTIVEAGRNQAKGQMVDVAICGHLPVYGDTPPSWLK